MRLNSQTEICAVENHIVDEKVQLTRIIFI